MLPPMRAVLFVLLVASCQQNTESKPAPAATATTPSLMATLTATEAEDLCNAVERSGALADVEENRNYLIADWLGRQIVSETGRTWMADFARLGQDRAARRAALDQLVRTHRLPGCPLVAMWQDS